MFNSALFAFSGFGGDDDDDDDDVVASDLLADEEDFNAEKEDNDLSED